MTADLILASAVAGAAGAAYLTAIAYAVVTILRSPKLETWGRAFWVAALVCVPLVAMVVWFVAGPRPFDTALSFSRR
ncbi:PLDc N-terminal domain-containing protein [Mycetocola zhadangensis]|uniref:Cardiolipin synthase N-terminal domain-containing protein n=1 Tax=Mycetocola zhadangensis TaxID=1164595 RepID=A0A3L7J1D8_9MICO|nr:PLDc N-terminal domain-containing protein [Mycetocola zhadangensis]RLQ84356.1 hypothetical protein D9V28_09165 [Mycetocola zhadangensis]GGE93743.1 hypothetical protein GCM10011313_15900 [Mycetocola zhadangensis]